MLRHRRRSRATPRRKLSALAARSAALTAPAEVPQITRNGVVDVRPSMCAMACSTPI